MANERTFPLNPLVQGWLRKIRLAREFKEKHFGKDAETAMKFFTCGRELNDLLWKERLKKDPLDDDEQELPAPKFRILVGKVAELVQLFGPSLYHRNPTVIVEPKKLDLPLDLLMSLIPPEMLQQAQQMAEMQGQQFTPESLFPPDPAEKANEVVAKLIEYYLNYIQQENDKKTHSRRMIDEALIKGMGVLWCEEYEPYEGGPKLIGSFYDTIDNVLVDPDADTFDDALWIVRECTAPVWKLIDEYPDCEKELSRKGGTHKSLTALGEESADPNIKDKERGKSNDLVTYYKVYSRMGMGHKLSGVADLEDFEELLDSFGENSYLVLSDRCQFPLNLSKKKLRAAIQKKDTEKREQVRERAFLDCQWPIPFWADGTWPATFLAFHEQPNNPWPVSHIKPGLGYLEFMTWTMSFLVNRVRTSCRTVASCMKSLEEDQKTRLFSGRDFDLIEVPMNVVPDGDIQKAVHFFDMPEINGETWKVLEACVSMFEKATGLNDLLYAAAGGFRTAQEVNVKSSNANVRPDDMANKVEDMLSLVARKEAMAARWLNEREDVEPILGERGANLWEKFVQSGDVNRVAREFHYRVEAGSTRKPNKETRVAQINQALQQWLPILGPWALQSGNHQVLNAFLEDWGRANDVEVGKYLLPPAPPPPPNPMQQKVEAELAIKREEHELKKNELAFKLQAQQQKQQLDLAGQQAQVQADVQKTQMDLAMNQAKAQQQLDLSRMKIAGDIELQQQQIGMKKQELEMGMAQRAQEMRFGAAQQKQQLEFGAQKHAQQLKQAAMKPPAGAAKPKPKAKGKKK